MRRRAGYGRGGGRMRGGQALVTNAPPLPTQSAPPKPPPRWVNVDVRADDALCDRQTRELADWYEREYGRG